MQTESSSLRRSSRRAKKRVTYSVGDIVEIVGTKDGIDRVSTKGRLISKLTAESASKHRWLVAYDDTSFPDEDLYESDFGEILGKETADSMPKAASSTRNRKAASNSSAPSTRKSALKGKNNKTKESPTVDATVVTPETKSSPMQPASTSKKTTKTIKNGKNNNNSKKQRVVNFDLPESGNATTDESSTAASERENKRAAAISAREARSKRRQAHFAVDAGVSQPPNKKAKTSHNSKKKSSTTEEVVRVPMLTGTLLLYRGKHPRAEFVRKF